MKKNEVSKEQAIYFLSSLFVKNGKDLVVTSSYVGNKAFAYNNRVYFIDPAAVKKAACRVLDTQSLAILASWVS